MRLLSFVTSFSFHSGDRAESVHTTSSFSPLAHVCDCACVYPWVLYISAEPQSTDGFLSVMEVNDFAPVFPNMCDISIGLSLRIYASLPWGFVSAGLYFLRDFSQPSVPVPHWRSCCHCSGRWEGAASASLLKMCVFVFLMCVYG